MQVHMLVLQGLTGRLISARYIVLHTTMHGDTLFAIVCPDGSTAANQKPCALRVYSLDVSVPAGSWQLCSPCAQDCEPDGTTCKYPMPRNQAACTDVGGKACFPAPNRLCFRSFFYACCSKYDSNCEPQAIIPFGSPCAHRNILSERFSPTQSGENTEADVCRYICTGAFQ